MSETWPNGIDLHLELDPATGRRAGLEEALRAAVRSGRLTPFARLPATRRLAAEVGLSRGTVRAAYDQLIAEGYLTARQGSGTTVAPLLENHGRPPTDPLPPSTGLAPSERPVPSGSASSTGPVPSGGSASTDPVPPRGSVPGGGSARTEPRAHGSVPAGRPLSSGRPVSVNRAERGERAEHGGPVDWTGQRPRHDLRPGSPDVSGFPVAGWVRSTRRALGAAPAEAYGYGDPRGRIELRTALAEYLGRTRGVLVRPELLVITNGYVQSLGLLVRALGPVILAMEDPGSPFHREVARRNGAMVVPLPVDDEGATLPTGVDAVEVTPAHQYPTGRTLSPSRRRAMTGWARSAGGLIIENDYDGEFRYDRQPVGALQGAAPDHVAYLGTTSKTLGPGLRLGWMVLPPRLLEPVVEAKRHSDRHTENIGQLTLADFIACHAYDRHVRACRLRYRRRRDLLLARLARSGFPVHGIAAGLQVLLSLPSGGPTERDVLQSAAVRDVAVGVLGDRWLQPGDHPQGIVVGYGTPSESGYPAALEALAHTL